MIDDNPREEATLIGAFHQGQAAADADAYRSDCPHMPGTDRYDAWMAGFEGEDGDTRWRVREGEPPCNSAS
jgi:hypothetical protein